LTRVYSSWFNLGFVGVGRSATAFLDWWWENTRREALIHPARMLFTAQRSDLTV